MTSGAVFSSMPPSTSKIKSLFPMRSASARTAEIFGNISEEQQANLSKLKPSLLYEAARPSAPAELVEAVKNGDIITIDITKHSISVDLTDEEIEKRRKAWTPPVDKHLSGILQKYRLLVSSAREGCVTV